MEWKKVDRFKENGLGSQVGIREVSEVFSDRGPEGEAFESPSLRSYQKG